MQKQFAPNNSLKIYCKTIKFNFCLQFTPFLGPFRRFIGQKCPGKCDA